MASKSKTIKFKLVTTFDFLRLKIVKPEDSLVNPFVIELNQIDHTEEDQQYIDVKLEDFDVSLVYNGPVNGFSDTIFKDKTLAVPYLNGAVVTTIEEGAPYEGTVALIPNVLSYIQGTTKTWS